jgi:hypothetical protein
MFQDEKECSLIDRKRSERLKAVTSNHVKVLFENDRRITIREIKDRVDCSIGTIYRIIHEELNMRIIYARWIPKM